MPTERPTERQVIDELTAPGARFEIETVDIRGVPTKAFVQRLRSLRELAELTATKRGDRVLLVHGERRQSYRDFFATTNAVAAGLLQAGVTRGDRVAILAANSPEWCGAFWATVNIGAVVAALNGWWKADEIRHGLTDAAPRVLVVDRPRLERVRPLLDEVEGLERVYVIGAEADDLAADPRLRAYADLEASDHHGFPTVPIDEDDPAVIIYTSGTTGRAKGAVGTHRSWIASTHNMSGVAAVIARTNPADSAPPAVDEVRLLCVPLFHVSGAQAHLVGGLLAGWTLVLPEGRFDPAEAMRLIEDERVTAWAAVPTMASRLCHHPDRHRYDLSSVRNVGFGGAPVPTDLARLVRETFPNLAYQANIYGLTETSGVSTANGGATRDARPTSVGRAMLTVDVEIRDEHDRPVAPGVTGEICVRGPHLFAGYRNQPEATAAALRHGWLHTGDLGHLDHDGYLYVTDRAKDMIIRGGENIATVEIEDRLCDHPAVAEAAVVGVPDADLGEAVHAAVHLAPGASATPDELRRWVAAALADFKVPRQIVVWAEPLPRNEAGKILKRAVRAAAAPESQASAGT